jgi:hypothetical protein
VLVIGEWARRFLRCKMSLLDGAPTPKKLAALLRCKTTRLADTVEKGKNEPIEIFACAPAETGFS